jgi:hypothetical protein
MTSRWIASMENNLTRSQYICHIPCSVFLHYVSFTLHKSKNIDAIIISIFSNEKLKPRKVKVKQPSFHLKNVNKACWPEAWVLTLSAILVTNSKELEYRGYLNPEKNGLLLEDLFLFHMALLRVGAGHMCARLYADPLLRHYLREILTSLKHSLDFEICHFITYPLRAKRKT